MKKTLLSLLAVAAATISATPGTAADRIAHHMDTGIPLQGTVGSPFDPTIDAIQANIFTPSCSQSYCHGVSQAAGLHLEDGFSYDSLVNKPSSVVPGALRVVPFSADDSYLVCKLESCPSMVGNPMPVIGGPLDPAFMAVIRLWIDNGAVEGPVAIDASTWGQIKATYR